MSPVGSTSDNGSKPSCSICDDGLSKDEEELCRSLVSSTPNWPKPGVTFLSVFPVLANANALSTVIGALSRQCRKYELTHIAGLDARGFPFGCAVARELNLGFLMIRKQGKLPPPVKSRSYDLEYGSATVEIPQDVSAQTECKRVVVMDDMIATGGTLVAGCKLLQDCGVEVVEAMVVIELTSLHGRQKLEGETNVGLFSLLRYDE